MISNERKEYLKEWRGKNKARLVELHKKWREENREHLREYSKNQMREKRATLKGYYETTKSCAKDRGKFKVMFSFEEFEMWYDLQKQRCSYCDIPQEVMIKLDFPWKFKVQKRLSLDRLDSNKDYTLDNICLACRVCNVVKNSILSANEMREISLIYIKPKWQKQLKPTK